MVYAGSHVHTPVQLSLEDLLSNMYLKVLETKNKENLLRNSNEKAGIHILYIDWSLEGVGMFEKVM